MKKVFLFAIAIIASVVSVNAQEAGKFRGGLELGYTIPKGGGGITSAVEVKYNLRDNMNVGLRVEDAFMAKEVGDEKANLSGNMGYLATFDYYFNSGTSHFAPFAGAGTGLYSLANISVDGSNGGVGVEGKFGGLVRAGFEYKKFRLTAAYNLIPASKVAGSTGDNIDVSNSYLSITVGFYLGGGSWKK